MTKSRLVSILLTLALAFAGTSAVVADSHEGEYDLSGIPEVNQDEALILLLQLREKLVAAGVADGDLNAAVGSLSTKLDGLSESDHDELLAASMLEDRDGGDDEFGKAEEDEPIGDDDDEEEDDD